jgi:alpha-beta hydrolase superfamily lysophospholipase
MRTIVELEIGGNRLVGTLHSATREVDGRAAERRRPGLLFLNSGFLPRSPVGDLTTHLADHFADLGISTFRFDMPGLGDSEGELPGDVETFFGSVLAGLHEQAAVKVSHELVQKYNLSGIYVGGLCGGAITSAYAAAAKDSEHIRGIAMLDPSFALQQKGPVKPAGKDDKSAPKPSLKLRAKHFIQELRVSILKTRAGQGVRKFYRYFKPVGLAVRRMLRKGRGEPLPSDANTQLLAAMKTVCQRKVPVLVLVAGSEEQHAEKYDYFKYIGIPQRGGQFYRYLPDTTHSFVEGTGEAVVTQQLEQWLLGVENSHRGSPAAVETQKNEDVTHRVSVSMS